MVFACMLQQGNDGMDHEDAESLSVTFDGSHTDKQ